MEFLLYLTPVGNEILNKLVSARFHIYENSGPCKVENVFGWVKRPNKVFICTDRIQSSGHDPYQYVNETLYHEAVHVAQICRSRKNFLMTDSLGLSKQNMPLSWNKREDIQKSIKATGDPNIAHMEHEAFYLEDKPEQVLKYVKKFCF